MSSTNLDRWAESVECDKEATSWGTLRINIFSLLQLWQTCWVVVEHKQLPTWKSWRVIWNVKEITDGGWGVLGSIISPLDVVVLLCGERWPPTEQARIKTGPLRLCGQRGVIEVGIPISHKMFNLLSGRFSQTSDLQIRPRGLSLRPDVDQGGEHMRTVVSLTKSVPGRRASRSEHRRALMSLRGITMILQCALLHGGSEVGVTVASQGWFGMSAKVWPSGKK